MLRIHEKRRLAICCRKKTTKLTNEEIAREFEVSLPSVSNALKWGKAMGLYDVDQGEQLENRIAEILTQGSKLEEMAFLVASNVTSRLKKGEQVNMAKEVVPLFKELRETRSFLSELQGLYKQFVNIKQEMNISISSFNLPDKIVNQEDWKTVIDKFEEMSNIEGGAKLDVDATTKAGLSSILG